LFQGDKFHIGTHNAARKVIDGISYVAESIGTVGSKPTKVVSDWMADQIAPPYWVPNAKIKVRSLFGIQHLQLNKAYSHN